MDAQPATCRGRRVSKADPQVHGLGVLGTGPPCRYEIRSSRSRSDLEGRLIFHESRSRAVSTTAENEADRGSS